MHFETHPTEDTLLSRTINNTLNLRLFSARCKESQSQGLLNQDYVQVHISRDGSSLCFCVCDGVGSSYRGDFAARFLGTRLVAWLRTLAISNWSAKTTEARLRAQLVRWAREAQAELQRHPPLPPETAVLVREVLEELRDTYGSETVFLGGQISVGPWATQLKKSSPQEAFFCWMGNVTARLFVTADQSMLLGGEETDASGWSTVRGLCGPLTIQQIGLTTLHRLVVHTDGLDALDATLADLDDQALQTHARQLRQLPASDDMTVLNLQWIAQNTEEKGM
jgi:hypothetical protein